MNTQEKIALVKELQTKFEATDAALQKLYDVFGSNPEGMFQEAVYGVLDLAAKAVAHAINDQDNWVYWFVYDNEFGKKAYEAGIGDKRINVKTPEDLITVLEMEAD